MKEGNSIEMCLACKHSREWGLGMSLFSREASYHCFVLTLEKAVSPTRLAFTSVAASSTGPEEHSVDHSFCPRALGSLLEAHILSWRLKNEWHLKTWVHIRWGAELLSIWSRTHSTIARYAVLCICHCFFEWAMFPPRYFQEHVWN